MCWTGCGMFWVIVSYDNIFNDECIIIIIILFLFYVFSQNRVYLIKTIIFFFSGHVTLTDLPENLQQLKQNVDENTPCIVKGSAIAVALKWGTEFEFGSFDYLLMADCIYYPEV